ncbi:AAA family ATPase [Streptomyces zhihengii]
MSGTAGTASTTRKTPTSREAPVVAELHERLAELVAEGRDVAWDHGLWPRKDRDAMKTLVESAGGRWRLLYFPVARDELLRRLAERNARGTRTRSS